MNDVKEWVAPTPWEQWMHSAPRDYHKFDFTFPDPEREGVVEHASCGFDWPGDDEIASLKLLLDRKGCTRLRVDLSGMPWRNAPEPESDVLTMIGLVAGRVDAMRIFGWRCTRVAEVSFGFMVRSVTWNRLVRLEVECTDFEMITIAMRNAGRTTRNLCPFPVLDSLFVRGKDEILTDFTAEHAVGGLALTFPTLRHFGLMTYTGSNSPKDLPCLLAREFAKMPRLMTFRTSTVLGWEFCYCATEECLPHRTPIDKVKLLSGLEEILLCPNGGPYWVHTQKRAQRIRRSFDAVVVRCILANQMGLSSQVDNFALPILSLLRRDAGAALSMNKDREFRKSVSRICDIALRVGMEAFVSRFEGNVSHKRPRDTDTDIVEE